LAFARLREVLGFGQRDIELAAGATVETLWDHVLAPFASAAGLRASTRFARNGALVDGTTPLRDGDEVALMPPVGGG
jgi:molybdopterin synthase catalytic subunit